MLLFADGHRQTGGIELIEQWRDHSDSKLWLDIDDTLTTEVRTLLFSMGCNELSVSDSSRQNHPPKIEVFEHNTFVLFRGLADFDEYLSLTPQQLDLWITDRYLISLRRGPAPGINHFWEQPAENSLLASPAKLALKLLHFASGLYLERILDFEDILGELEDALLTRRSEDVMKELVLYRSRLRKLRRIFSYHKDMTEDLLHDGSPHLGHKRDHNHHQRRDLYDRCERLYSLCNMFYELCGDLIEGHISITSHHLSNTMKILTIITAIFIPLSFLAGLYGMNFDYIPELRHHYGYFILLTVMATLAGGMLLLFRHIRWL
ncbi:MAG: magnesium transporter CorA family protein [Parahaliea sp.]